MPEMKAYLPNDLFIRWLQIPKGERSKIIQELLKEYFRKVDKK